MRGGHRIRWRDKGSVASRTIRTRGENLQMETTSQRRGMKLKGVAHLRNSRWAIVSGTQLHRGKEPLGAAPLRNSPVTTLGRKQTHRLQFDDNASTSGGGLVDIVTNLPDATELTIRDVERRPDVVVHVEDQAPVLQLGDLLGEIVRNDGEGDAIANVDLGVAGDPILVGDLSSADYANLVSNVVPCLPSRVDGDDRQ